MPDAPRLRRSHTRLDAVGDLRTVMTLVVAFVPVCALVPGLGLFGLSELASSHDRLDGLSRQELVP